MGRFPRYDRGAVEQDLNGLSCRQARRDARIVLRDGDLGGGDDGRDGDIGGLLGTLHREKRTMARKKTLEMAAVMMMMVDENGAQKKARAIEEDSRGERLPGGGWRAKRILKATAAPPPVTVWRERTGRDQRGHGRRVPPGPCNKAKGE